MKCPQCTSDGCGPVRCRFTMKDHESYREQCRRSEQYAQAQIQADLERPQWLRDHLTGAADPAVKW